MASKIAGAMASISRVKLPAKMARPEVPAVITKQDITRLYLHLLRAKSQLKFTDKQFYMRRMRKEFEKRRRETDKSKIKLAFEVRPFRWVPTLPNLLIY